jgi:Mg-chelatase subunit ChlI
MVNSVLKAQGQKECMLVNGDQLPADVYDLRYLKTGANLEEMARLLGIHPEARICLHGPPGTGKTMMAKAVANITTATFIRVVGSEFVQKYLGEGPRMVRDVFKMAKENSPSIVFIDEVDSIATKYFLFYLDVLTLRPEQTEKCRECSSSCSTKWTVSSKT